MLLCNECNVTIGSGFGFVGVIDSVGGTDLDNKQDRQA